MLDGGFESFAYHSISISWGWTILCVDLNGLLRIIKRASEALEVDEEGPAWWHSAKGFFKAKGQDDPDDKERALNYSPESWGRLQTIQMMLETMQDR